MLELSKRVELSNPEHRVAHEMPEHNQDFGQRLRRVRENPETGNLSGGEATGIYLADISKEEFACIVDIYLSMQALPPQAGCEVPRVRDEPEARR